MQQLVRATAPWGVDVEVVLQLADASSPFASALVPGGFLTDGVGFGHAVFATTAFEESHPFLTEGLGFAQSDWLETEIAPGIDLEVRFYHCNRRHHTIALARAPFDLPQRLHHIMFELNERDDVGAAFDRAWATGLAIPNGLGRHDNDGMFSFYLQTPAGFQVEVGHGARVITEGWDDNRRYDQISAWGHQPLRLTALEHRHRRRRRHRRLRAGRQARSRSCSPSSGAPSRCSNGGPSPIRFPGPCTSTMRSGASFSRAVSATSCG